MYLFPPLTGDLSSTKPTAKCPILCDTTRKPLYDLILALCDSSEAYERVVRVLEGVVVPGTYLRLVNPQNALTL